MKKTNLSGPDTNAATELVNKLTSAAKSIKNQLSRRIIGQDEVIDDLLVSFFSKGHCLIVGVPGLAKTLIVSTLAEILGLKFSRIQFTPDLMPSDITGTEIIQEDAVSGEKVFRFIKGPIFTQVLLADEINRTPPKTQSALLEAMQELKITYAGKTYHLEEPFFVLATQNPIEQEGTYPLPEAQLDRFFFQINITYPDYEEEKLIVKETTSFKELPKTEKVLTTDEILRLQDIVRDVPVSDVILDKIINLVRATRPQEMRQNGNNAIGLDEIARYVLWGAGPRGAQALTLASKAHAILKGRMTVSSEDVASVVKPALRHRLILNYAASADGITADDIIDKLFSQFFT